MNDHVTLEAAQLLKDLGMPRGTSQCSYYDMGGTPKALSAFEAGVYGDFALTAMLIAAAPSHLRALDWLEQENGVQWYKEYNRDAVPLWYAHVPQPDAGYGPFAYVVAVNDPDAFIIAICQKLKEVQDAER